MRHGARFVTALLTAMLIAEPATAGCCICEYRAPRTQPLRGLIHQIAVWDLRCQEARTQAAVDQACARRDRLTDRVERMGWCWGSSVPAPRMAFYWLPCRRNHYRP
jgi:hypothetical protein